MNTYLDTEIRAGILAGLVQAFVADTGNVEFLRGTVAAYQHQALTFGLDWRGIVTEAKALIGRDELAMLEARPYITIEKGEL